MQTKKNGPNDILYMQPLKTPSGFNASQSTLRKPRNDLILAYQTARQSKHAHTIVCTSCKTNVHIKNRMMYARASGTIAYAAADTVTIYRCCVRPKSCRRHLRVVRLTGLRAESFRTNLLTVF